MNILKIKNPLMLIGMILASHLAGAIGSMFTFSSIDSWYASLVRPEFAPPNWLFGPVWLTLYTLMGIAAYLVWMRGWKKEKVKIAVYLFFGQLVLNALWSYLFFGLQNPFYGLVGISVLWVFIVLTIYKFYEISKNAAYLLIPYILWVSFATVLNYYIWILNV